MANEGSCRPLNALRSAAVVLEYVDSLGFPLHSRQMQTNLSATYDSNLELDFESH